MTTATPSQKVTTENQELLRLQKIAQLDFEDYVDGFVEKNFENGIKYKGKHRQVKILRQNE